MTWINIPGHPFEARVRTMEIFLDAVAAHASTDASWLLDPRFSGLLTTEQGRKLAADADALYAQARDIGGSLCPSPTLSRHSVHVPAMRSRK